MTGDHEFPLPYTARRLAHLVMILVLCTAGAAGLQVVLASAHDPLGLVVGLGAVCALVAIQLCVVDRVRPRTSRSPPGRFLVAALVLLVQAVLVCLPTLVIGVTTAVLPGLLAGSVLLLLPARFGVPLFGVVLAGVGVLGWSTGADVLQSALVVLVAAFVGLVVHVLTTLRRAVDAHQFHRSERDRVVASEERLRLARDVHDLLGLSLLAISVKTELTAKLLVDDPGRAGVELDEVLRLARQGLSDVRAVAGGVRGLSFEDELRHVGKLLREAGIDVRLRRDLPELGEPASMALAVVLRECATNILRHSDASVATIVLGRAADGGVLLRVENDGARRVPRDRLGGQGIRNITERAGALGGEVRSEVRGGTYALEVRLPAA